MLNASSVRVSIDAWITSLPIIFQDSDGEKSDDLVVDVSNEVSIDGFQRLIAVRETKTVARRNKPLPPPFLSPGPGDSAGESGPLAAGERHRQAPPSQEGHAQQPGLGGVLRKHPIVQGQGAQSCK